MALLSTMRIETLPLLRQSLTTAMLTKANHFISSNLGCKTSEQR